jgi:hypothetical protein
MGPIDGTFQLVVAGFWTFVSYSKHEVHGGSPETKYNNSYNQHCFQYYLEGTVVFLTVIHENAGLFAVVRLELQVQQSFSFPFLLQTLIFAISKCV